MLLIEYKEVQGRLDKRVFRPTSPLQLLESNGTVTYRISGVFQNWMEVNANRRRYRKELWENQFKTESPFNKKLAERSVLGMIEHPADGITRLDEVSHVITDVRFATESEIAQSKGKPDELREGDILGTLEILPTPRGQILKGLVEAKIPFGVSSRGSGTVTESNGHLEVNDDFLLETWDAVFSPSVERAIPRLVQEVANGKVSNIGESINQIEQETPHQQPVLIDTIQLGEKKIQLHLHDGSFIFEGLEIGPFKSVSESLAGIGAYALKHRIATPASTPKATATPQPVLTESKTMSKLTEIKAKRTEVLRLIQTETKALKPSDKSALFDSADDLRQQIAGLIAEDATIQPHAKDLYERLDKFTKRLDEDDETAPPPPGSQGGPPPPPGNQQGAPPPGNQQGPPKEGCEDCDVIMRAAELLRDQAEQNPEGGEEALQTAEELEGVADRIGGGDTAVEDGEPFEDIPVPDDIPMEAKRIISRYQRRLNINENRSKRLSAATETLLSEHQKLKKSSRANGESGLYESAARKLADRYNTDMCELGLEFFKVTQPALFEANKAKLEATKKWKELSALTESLMAAAKPPGTPAPGTAPGAPPVTESTPPPGSPPAGTPPPAAAPGTPPPAAPITESVQNHFALQMLSRSRKGVPA